MVFEWTAPARIVFGRGAAAGIGRLAAEIGRRVLFIRAGALPATSGTVEAVRVALAAEGLEFLEAEARGEPEVEAVDALTARVRPFEPDVILGLGGGSAIDTAKAVAGLLAGGGEVLDYLEVIGRGRPFGRPGVPVIAVPTTAGTGAEATRNAVLASRAFGVKASLRGPALVPRLAVVDPALTDTLPPAVTASTGLDALTQCLESYLALNSRPWTDALALEGLNRAARSLVPAFRGGSAPEARDDMALAALLSGLCLTNAGLGAVHGLAAALGGKFPIPHGVACGRVLPGVLSENVRAMPAGGAGRPVPAKCLRLADVFLPAGRGSEKTRTAALGDRLSALVEELEIPRLSAFGVTEADLPALAEAAGRSRSIRQNPVALAEKTLRDILRAAL